MTIALVRDGFVESVRDVCRISVTGVVQNGDDVADLLEFKWMCSESANELIEVSMRMDDFSSEWMHCDRISSYIARLVAQDRPDPLYYENLFSSAMNELLETVYLNHGSEGDLTCRVRRMDETDVIEIGLPSDEKTSDFYTDVVSALDGRDIEDLYNAALFAAGQRDARLGMFELAVDYKAKITVLTSSGRLTLSTQIAFGGAQ